MTQLPAGSGQFPGDLAEVPFALVLASKFGRQQFLLSIALPPNELLASGLLTRRRSADGPLVLIEGSDTALAGGSDLQTNVSSGTW